jgi:NAD(P)-dependent dehydrogenase (short-subunit alcohol dehydrogenase family)
MPFLAGELRRVRKDTPAGSPIDFHRTSRRGRDEGHLDERREELRATLPIRRVVGPQDVAELALHLMRNEALTGATYDIDGGQQLL